MFVLFWTLIAAAQAPPNREHFAHADVLYDWVTNGHGERLRTQAMQAFADFYDLYLNHGLTPGEILRQRPDWKPIWYDSADG